MISTLKSNVKNPIHPTICESESEICVKFTSKPVLHSTVTGMT